MSVRRLTLLSFLCLVWSVTGRAQGVALSTQKVDVTRVELLSAPQDGGRMFTHLDASLHVGSTGIGIELATPMGRYARLRAGYAFMPQFKKTTKFDVQVGEHKEKKVDDEGNRIETKLDRMAKLLNGLTGFSVDDHVDMYCVPTYHNYKLLADFFPFRSRRWHLTAGIFYGNRQVAKAYNTTDAMPSLLAVNMYNRMYTNIANEDPVVDVSYGQYHISFELEPEMSQRILSNGRMSMGVGRWKEDHYDAAGNLIAEADKPYLMEPDADGMVKVRMTASRLKPYLGFGYERPLSADGQWYWTFDVGAMYWGGVPHMKTHEGVDLTRDLIKVKGKVGRYVHVAKALPVFPVIELKVSRRIY